jgi:cytosine/adenosine deaminase-related metal-dependent hydrolase
MATLLIKNADLVATMNDADDRIPNGAVLIENDVIRAVGPSDELDAEADETIDARGTVVLPGLVNTHHHFFQTLTRNLPGGQNAKLFDWLVYHYPIWAKITPAGIKSATRVAIAELMLSGCTTASDHTYLWANGARLDDQIEAAQPFGFRFHAAHGSMSVGESKGGLPPDSVVEDEAFILSESRRLIETYHDPRPGAMLRIVLAPCSPFSVSPNLMRESAELARSYGVHLHTHLAETRDEEEYCLAAFGKTPVELAEDLGWVGSDVWHAHMVHPHDDEITRLGRTSTGAAHCPTSNMRLASGIAPLRRMLDAEMRIGLGVDGSASNDGSHLLTEARHAMLLQRVAHGSGAASAEEVLRLATRGGAAVLGRDDIGQLAPGKQADLVGFRIDTLPMAGGAVHDPLAALVFCQPPNVDLSVINGKVRIRGGEFVDIELRPIIDEHNRLSAALLG